MSQITLRNQTGEIVRIAVYYKPSFARTLATVAWQIVTPPPGGQTAVPIPAGFTVYAEYSLDPSQPDPTAPGATAHTTNVLSFAETSARFLISTVESQNSQAAGAVAWAKAFGGTDSDEANALGETLHGFFVMGEEMSFGKGFFLLSLDANGSRQWSRSYGPDPYLNSWTAGSPTTAAPTSSPNPTLFPWDRPATGCTSSKPIPKGAPLAVAV